MLRIAHLNARYAGRPALQDISLQLDKGELLVVLGPSGCGKTTLLNLIAGFLPVESGSITLEGKTISGPGAERGVVFQHEGLLPWRNVLDNVAFGLQLAGMARSERNVIARRLLKKVGLRARRIAPSGSSPAANASASASPVRWQPIPSCCCLTSPLGRWMPLPANRCKHCC